MNRFRLAMLLPLAFAACKTTGADVPAEKPTPAAEPKGDPNAGLAGQEWRKERPETGSPPALELPTFERAQLKNGLTILVSEQRQLPLASFVLVTRGGSALDPNRKAGLTSLSYQLLGEGAGARDSLQFSDAVADLGASFSSGADQDSGYVSINGLSRNAEAMLALLADAALRPRLTKRDFDRIKNQALGNIVRRKGSPSGLAFEVVPAMIFGEQHPYGHPVSGTEKTVSGLTSSDVQRQLKKLLVPSESALIAVGDIDLKEATRVAEKFFGKWRGKKRKTGKNPEVPARERKKITIVNKPGAPQTMLVIGRPAFGRGNPDEIAMVVGNEVFGGAFTSRLNMNLREDKGYSYGARSSISRRNGAGAFIAYALVRQDATAASLKETFAELHGMLGRPPNSAEVQAAKAGLILSLPGDFERTSAAASAANTLFVYGLPLDHYRTWPGKVESLTEQTIAAALKKHITPDKTQIVLVGDAEKIKASIAELKLGEVVVVEP